MSEWLGPSWGQYTVARKDANTASGIAVHNFNIAAQNADAADKWRAHTEKLRIELDRVWDMYQSKSAAEAGQAAMKEAALVEIERIDPVNKMLNLEYRKKIYDLAHKESLAEKSE